MTPIFNLFDRDTVLAGRAARRTVRELTTADQAEVLSFLSAEPLRTVQMLGLLADHGISSPALRGRFYGYYEDDFLMGIALLGHAILFHILPEAEAAALGEFARIVAEHRIKGHVLFGPCAQADAFFNELSRHGRTQRLQSDHLWCVCEKPALPLAQLQLNRANLDELDALAEAQAEMVREASGIDPRQSDPEGFRTRVAERIERKRTWVRLLDDKVVFKVEIVSETEQAAYLEGVWTHPDYRGRSIARTCMNELVHRLTRQKKSVCLIVEPDETAARRIYEQVGFVPVADCRAIYLSPAR